MKFDKNIKNLLTKILRSPIIEDKFERHLGRSGGGSLPRWAGTPFRTGFKLSSKIQKRVDSEINTVFKARYATRIGKMCSISVDDYWYAFVPIEFNEYDYCECLKIQGNEDDINIMEKELYKK